VRHRLRIQPYVTPELRRRVQAAALSDGVTESAVIEAALSEYFAEKKVDDELMLRRLDFLGQSVARLQSDVDVLADAFGRYVRYLFLAAITKTGPDQKQRTEAEYQTFLQGLFDQNCTGTRFTAEVRRARIRPPAPPSRPPVGGQ
jgi:hypothetical protein